MADSIPSLRRKLNEAMARIRELESRPPEIREVVREVQLPGEVIIKEVEKPIPFEVVKVEYRDKIVEVPGETVTVEIEKPVPFEVEVVKWREVVKEGPERVVTVERIVEVPGPERVFERVVEIAGPERVIYQDNPDHIAMIKKLQEKLCQFTSQSGS